ncbi:sensor histidine kinase [Actinokineospora globicatena]|uniref:sensor histidine kinase n=1 Tax=Actinokineospora globicatena TaxID=103729 RepID=UPI0020A5A0A3|nr:histidine kinase [Actinokineospora globicatena]MCP2304571.1 Histidine kinase [Actinokineospora globicatena]
MYDLFRSLWREPRPAAALPLRWWDWVLVGVLVSVALVEGVARGGVVSTVLAVGLVPVLLVRRSAPLGAVGGAFGVCAVASVMMGRNFPDLNVMVYLVLLPFALFRWGSGREAGLGAVVMVGQVGLAVLLGYQRVADAGAGVLVLAAAMAVGAAVRYRSRARTRQLDQVRLLLARDLHDTVAHHVSAMAIRAQAGIAVAPSDPAAAVAALRVIEQEAGRALDEMRALVRVLRAGELPEMGPVGDLTSLTSTGHPTVDVRVVGDAAELPAPIAATVFRLAQEAVTNARRHARHATAIEVLAEITPTTIHLHITDDGDPPPARPPGLGLTGMLERATLLGGTCTAGPSPERGWTVTADLPRTGVAR